jgi:hypothetical protein
MADQNIDTSDGSTAASGGDADTFDAPVNAASGNTVATGNAPGSDVTGSDQTAASDLDSADAAGVAAMAELAGVTDALSGLSSAGQAMQGAQFSVAQGIGATTPATDATPPTTAGQTGTGGTNAPPQSPVTATAAKATYSTAPAAAAQPSYAQIIVDAGAAASKAASDLGITLTPQCLALILSQISFESQYGRLGTMGGTNNWGAYQAGSYSASSPTQLCKFIATFASTHANDPGFGGVAHRDYQAAVGSNSSYNFVGFYRIFPSQYAAARDWITNMQGRLNLKGSQPADPTDYATRCYLGGYFGGVHDGARPLGSRSVPLNDAEAANVADYANAISRNMGTVQAALSSKLTPMDPTHINVGPFASLQARLSAGSGCTVAGQAAQAAKWFPPGGKYGDYAALVPTNGLAWVKSPPPGMAVNGTASLLGGISFGGGTVGGTVLTLAGGLLLVGGIGFGVFHHFMKHAHGRGGAGAKRKP